MTDPAAPVPGARTAAVPRPPLRSPLRPPVPAPVSESRRGSSHPAVDAAIQAIVNAAQLAPADQIAQYEAAYHTLRETLATIDQA